MVADLKGKTNDKAQSEKSESHAGWRKARERGMDFPELCWDIKVHASDFPKNKQNAYVENSQWVREL